MLVRFRPEQRDALDAWIERQPQPRPSRPEAVRQLVQHALAGGGPKPARSLKEQIATAKRKAATPLPDQPSPERGTAMLRKGKAEAGLAGLQARAQIEARSRGCRPAGPTEGAASPAVSGKKGGKP